MAQRAGAGGRGDRDPGPRPRDRQPAHPARPGVLPVARPGHGLRRPVPRRAAAHRALPDRLRGARAAAAGRAHRRRRARDGHADPHLLRLRGRGVPGRDRVGAPVAAGGGAVAGAVPPAVDAPGDPPAGRAARAAAVAQRLRRAPEGRRADLGARRRRRDPGRADRGRAHVQLHPLRRGRAAVRAARDPDRADRGRGGARATRRQEGA